MKGFPALELPVTSRDGSLTVKCRRLMIVRIQGRSSDAAAKARWYHETFSFLPGTFLSVFGDGEIF